MQEAISKIKVEILLINGKEKGDLKNKISKRIYNKLKS